MIKVSNGNPFNKNILVISGSHAREWIAIMSNLIILREIVTKYDEQPTHIKDKDWLVKETDSFEPSLAYFCRH
jgi:hypothetical protein